jgi:hypothetical protein
MEREIGFVGKTDFALHVTKNISRRGKGGRRELNFASLRSLLPLRLCAKFFQAFGRQDTLQSSSGNEKGPRFPGGLFASATMAETDQAVS